MLKQVPMGNHELPLPENRLKLVHISSKWESCKLVFNNMTPNIDSLSILSTGPCIAVKHNGLRYGNHTLFN